MHARWRGRQLRSIRHVSPPPLSRARQSGKLSLAALGQDSLGERVEMKAPADHMAAMAIQIRTSLAEPDSGQSFVPHRPARPDKAEGGRPFVLSSEYQPAGDQPTAIR